MEETCCDPALSATLPYTPETGGRPHGHHRGSKNHERLRAIREFPESFVNDFRIAARFSALISVRLVHLVLTPGIIRGCNTRCGKSDPWFDPEAYVLGSSGHLPPLYQ
jgi:hypothetical protein